MSIEVVHMDPTRLGQQRWRFSLTVGFHDITVVLDSYRQEYRASTRHKFVAEYKAIYERIDSRNGGMVLADVPQPVDVIGEVMVETVKLIHIVIQDKRGVQAPFGLQPVPSASELKHGRFMAKVRS